MLYFKSVDHLSSACKLDNGVGSVAHTVQIQNGARH